MNHRVSVVIEQDEDGFYAYAPELPGCQTQGDTLDEAMGNIREAIDLYIETLDLDERRQLVSKHVMTTSVEVAVA